MKTIIQIEGMTCAHCVARVGSALKTTGAKGIKVDLSSASAEIEAGSANGQALRDAIEEAGYTVIGIAEAPGFSLFRN